LENRRRAGQCAGDEITEITRRPRYSVRPGSRKTISFRLRFSLSVFNGHTADGFRPSDAPRFPGHPNLANVLVRVRQLRQSYNTYRDVIPVGGTTDVNNRKDSWRTRRKRVGAMDGEMPDELRRRVTSETTPANYSLTLLRSKSVSLWVTGVFVEWPDAIWRFHLAASRWKSNQSGEGSSKRRSVSRFPCTPVREHLPAMYSRQY